MVPPFLAYYGVMTRNSSLLVDAYNQIQLYRSYLRDPDANNIWRHIVLGVNSTDPGHWSTGKCARVLGYQPVIQLSIGNGWAAAGMLRVLGTIQNSEYANTLKSEQSDLMSWVKEIHTGMYSFLVRHHSYDFMEYVPKIWLIHRTQTRACSPITLHNRSPHRLISSMHLLPHS